MVRFASLFNMVERTVTFLSGKRYSLDMLRSLGAGELLNSMCEFSEKLAALRLDADEMSLFTAVVLVSAGKTMTWIFRAKDLQPFCCGDLKCLHLLVCVFWFR